MIVEISKEAFYLLVGNEEKSWRNYKQGELSESSYYYNKGVSLEAVHNYTANVTQYYVQDINY